MGYPSFPSSEAKALHAAIDGDTERVVEAVADYSAFELNQTATVLDNLADQLRRLAEGRS
jgi:hypothetical protein